MTTFPLTNLSSPFEEVPYSSMQGGIVVEFSALMSYELPCATGHRLTWTIQTPQAKTLQRKPPHVEGGVSCFYNDDIYANVKLSTYHAYRY